MTDTIPRLFNCLSRNEYDDFCREGRSIHLTPGEFLFHQGEQVRSCFVVRSGQLKLTKINEEGKEVIYRFLGCGEVTGAVTVLKDALYPVTAEAVGKVKLTGWGKEALLSLMRSYPDVAINLLAVVFERMDDIQKRYLELCTEQVEQRIARSLLRLMQRSGEKTDSGITISLPLSRQDIADYSGTTLHTVSRTLSAWEKNGWVRSGRQRVTVTDPHRLVELADKSFSPPP